jgi:hypothetical protein
MYNNYTCQVIHNVKATDPIAVKSGVWQACILSLMLFLLVMDKVMRRVTEGKRRGIQWGLTEQLEDLDFADDIYLLSQKCRGMAEKLCELEDEEKLVGLKMNSGKTKLMKINTNVQNQLQVNGDDIEAVEEFTYLGSVVTRDGGAVEDVRVCIQKANAAFIQLYSVWRAREITTTTKIRIFRTNVKAVLLYGCETWKVTSDITNRIQVFINRCLRRIIRVFWPNLLSNEELWSRRNEEPVVVQIKRRKWRWFRNTL